MTVAIMGSLHLIKDTINFLAGKNIRVSYIIIPIDTVGDITPFIPSNIQPISTQQAIDLYYSKKIDAVILYSINMPDYGRFVSLSTIRTFKLTGVENIYAIYHYPYDKFDNSEIVKLNSEKFSVDYIESNLIDNCNLNCRSCTHFASLFEKNSIYPVELFKRDCRELSKKIEIAYFRLLGGEPFLLKNLDEYLNTARQYFQNSFIVLVTNGLLISSVSDKIFESIKQNQIIVEITLYPPTIKMKDRIESVLNSKGIIYNFGREVTTFGQPLRYEPGLSNIDVAFDKCISQNCLFLRDGKIYKCPIEALIYKYKEKFTDEYVPQTMSADIYSENFLEMLSHIAIFPVQMCEICTEHPEDIPWQIENNPVATDFQAQKKITRIE